MHDYTRTAWWVPCARPLAASAPQLHGAPHPVTATQITSCYCCCDLTRAWLHLWCHADRRPPRRIVKSCFEFLSCGRYCRTMELQAKMTTSAPTGGFRTLPRTAGAKLGSSRVAWRTGTGLLSPVSVSVATRGNSCGCSSGSVRASVTGAKKPASSGQVATDEKSAGREASSSTNDESPKSASWNGGAVATETTVSISVVGASGDLAKKKIFPALFALYYEGCLPKHFTIFGFARSKMTDESLRETISGLLTCRIDQREKCGDKQEEFLKRCFYHAGQYNSEESFGELSKKLEEHEGGRVANRLFYLSIPPDVFVDAARSSSLAASSANGWTRVIVEKPFGRDSESSAELTAGLKKYLKEDQIYRIDHYLGKELVENLSVLRFSNLVFEPLWSRQYIRNVQLIFSEDFGTEGRGGYFDNYGIIRDIMQNHLLQILALFAMEPPVSLEAEDIRNEKVKVLRSMKVLDVENLVVGQYKGHTRGGVKYPAYVEDKTVPNNSLTPTFAAAALFIDNARWDGVPFLMKAGKALHRKRAEIRVQFRHVPGNLYKRSFGTDLDLATNELVIRIQPDEAIYLKINNKVPGLGMRLDRSNLNLHYTDRYDREIPDAYERLILDAIEGERRLFIRSDELDAAWALFTPLLKELESRKVAPELYPYGSRGPVGAHYLAAKYNVRWGDHSSET